MRNRASERWRRGWRYSARSRWDGTLQKWLLLFVPLKIGIGYWALIFLTASRMACGRFSKRLPPEQLATSTPAILPFTTRTGRTRHGSTIRSYPVVVV